MEPGSGLAEDGDINQGMENSRELEHNQGVGLKSRSRDKGILREPLCPSQPLLLLRVPPWSWICLVAWGELLLGTEVKVADKESGPTGHQLFYPLNATLLPGEHASGPDPLCPFWFNLI